ncbi:MAG: hypothetical protein R3332_04990 [Pseudohongiellaceae bacterium]|nr:hypothetical protein [Pseudohongiellaceae bacterium]
MNTERRARVRYTVNFSANMRVPSNAGVETFPVSAINMSATSLEVSCDAAVFDCLQTQESFPYECELEFSLPEEGDACMMPCQVLRYRRLSQRHYQIVLDFLQELPIAPAALAV